MTVVTKLNNQGCKLTESGCYGEAIKLHAEALAMLGGCGEQSDELFATHRYLGENYNVIGEYALAESHYLESCRKADNGVDDHHDNYHYHLFMGDLLKNRGDEEALVHYENARDIRIMYCGRHSVEVAEIDIVLGEFYNTIGDSDNAIEWLDVACDIIEETVGESSVEMARYYTAMGAVLRDMGLADRSIEYLDIAYKIQMKHGVKCDIDRASTLENMALSLSNEEIDEVDKAFAKLESAKKIYEKYYPANHHYIAGIYNIYGVILMDSEQIPEALAMFIKALAMQRETLAEMHFDLADSYINIATAHFLMGDVDIAMEYFTIAEPIQGAVYQKGHCHKTFGCAALIEGRFDDAHRELFKALEIYSSCNEGSSIDIIETKCYIDDLRQRIESSTKSEVYMDSERLVYCTKSDDYGICYSSDMRTILNVPEQIGRSLVGYKSKGVTGCYIECYDSVKIPIAESVTTISRLAFANNEGVNRVYLPNVTTVEAHAFERCASLREVVFALGASIHEDAFTGCDRLEVRY